MVNKFSTFLGILIFLIYGCGENVSDKKEYAEFIKGSWIFVKSDDPDIDSCFNYFILFKNSLLIANNKFTTHKSEYVISYDTIFFDEQREWYNYKRPNFMFTDSLNHKSSFIIDSIDSMKMVLINKLGYKYQFKNLNYKSLNYKQIALCDYKIYTCPECYDTTHLSANYQIVKNLWFRQLFNVDNLIDNKKYKNSFIIQEREISEDDFLKYEKIINHYLNNEFLENNCSLSRLYMVPKIELYIRFEDNSDTFLIIRNLPNSAIKSGMVSYFEEINPFEKDEYNYLHLKDYYK